MSSWEFEREYKLPRKDINFIDLIEVAPLKASLKIYAGRLHCVKMQDLPFEDTRVLSSDEMEIVKDYCGNDLINTNLLLKELTPQIELRRKMSNQYQLDLRSKSDAQIAETVIKAELFRKNGVRAGKPEVSSGTFHYELPNFIEFKTDKLNHALLILAENTFTVSHSGRIEMPKSMATLQIRIGSTVYQMGMGGLHSQEKCVFHETDDDNIVCDLDVTSYYPTIILNCGLYPKQLGKDFLDIYRELVETRIAGKRAGNMVIADSLRIVVNGSFGKLGSPYSALYSPELMIQTTVTGQLALLMLIEALELKNIPVVSGNTDGIVVKCPREKESKMEQIIQEWQEQTMFNMERTNYRGIYSRDVNNYIAIKDNGKVKTKGCFSSGGLAKNPQNEICNEAVIEYLKSKKPFIQTLRECQDVTKFLTLRTVKGGAVKGKVYLGKAVRWLYTASTYGSINYKTSGNKVPRTEGATPLMDLPEVFPDNINYKWYETECKELLSDIGVDVPKQPTLLLF
jgi:hypothetical protein